MTKKLKDIIWIKNEENFILNNSANVDSLKSLLNETGSGFCLAKFTQATLHLGTGNLHSCHHPRVHSIPVQELEQDPNALFNTTHLKKMRELMMTGQRPSECDYCWRIEDSNGTSDRFYKSMEPWALQSYDKVIESGPNENYYPTYLEVDFSNVCNFKCIYCGPEYSSQWVEELKRNGPVKVLDNTPHVQWVQGWQDLNNLNIKNSEYNPYIDAYWKWFPEAYKHLKVYRITGGEPLLSKETFKSIDWLIENPNPELEFNINSNLGVPEQLWDKFIEKIKILITGNRIKKFTLFTSVDTFGNHAEYLRPGLDFKLFQKRFEKLLAIGDVRCTIMCTFNILSLPKFKDFLSWVLTLKREHNQDPILNRFETEFGYKLTDGISHTERAKLSPSHHSIVGLDIPYLRHPEMLDVHFADKNLIENFLIPAMEFMASNQSNNIWGLHQGFEEYEVEKFKRIVIEAMKYTHDNSEDSTAFIINRAKFYDFITDMDKRHNKNFLTVFPEMEIYYHKCREAKTRLNRELING